MSELTHTPSSDLTSRAAERLQAAQDANDEERLRVLDDLYGDLEAELERDLEQARSAGR